MPLIVANGIVLLNGVLESGRDIVIEDGKITRVKPPGGRLPADRLLDATGRYVLPGLIDLHSHGMRDVMVDKDDIFRYAGCQLDCGVTSCLPTLAGSPEANMARMREILEQTRELRLTPNLLGFRPEIMYLADASGGPASSLARPTPRVTEAVWEASRETIRIWDVSPEIEGAIPFIQWCASHGS